MSYKTTAKKILCVLCVFVGNIFRQNKNRRNNTINFQFILLQRCDKIIPAATAALSDSACP